MKTKNNDGQEYLDRIAHVLGFTFKNDTLLLTALTHRSYLVENKQSQFSDNQRLEWFGDVVLGLVVTEYLYEKLPESDEGVLSKLKSQLVSQKVLAKFSRTINLGNYLLLGKGEDDTGGRRRDSILSDALEALIGAIYLDHGLTEAREFILKYHGKEMEKVRKTKPKGDFKSLLQEKLQKDGSPAPVYELLMQSGPDHKKVFTVRLCVKDREYCGTGFSKKEAEQMAAWVAMDHV